ncbi:MAG: hypothetical protein WC635_13110 [Bacteriovorax sp.]|jgi:hypothetical protein
MKKLKMLMLNNSGFGIIGVIIIAGVLGGISLVIIEMGKQAASSQKKLQTDMDADFIAKEISGILADATVCTASQIAGKNAASTPAGLILDIIGKYSVTNTTGFGSSHIKVKSYEISNNNFAEITDPNTETALVINFAMPKIVSSSATLKPRRIKLIITKSGSNIATCNATWVNPNDNWSRVGNNIYYGLGKIGIGAPAAVGLLEVDGGIRPGSSGISVDGACSVEGTFAYDAVLHKPVYCNETLVWKGM